MELRARLVVEGFLQGMHRSPYHGFSVEFAEYRQYMPGDAPRYVDWKAYGKTDRYYVKVFEEETNLKGVILLDKSASMGFAGKGISKLRWGSLLAAALAFLMIKQQDAAGLVLFDDAIRELHPAALGARAVAPDVAGAGAYGAVGSHQGERDAARAWPNGCAAAACAS